MRVSAVVVNDTEIKSFFIEKGDLKMEDIEYDHSIPDGNYISVENCGIVNFVNKLSIIVNKNPVDLTDIPSEKIKEILKSRTRDLIFNR